MPRKNLALVAGRPLIAWSIAAALEARSVTRVVVSTDDDRIRAVARRYGAEAPFTRPARLAGDRTPTIDVVLHAMTWLARHEGYHPKHLVCLQPTSPLRTSGDIDAATRLLRTREADAVVSVTSVHQHPAWLKRLLPSGRITSLGGRASERRRQDLEPLFIPNGAIYLARTDVLTRRRTWYTERTYGYVMPPERSLDIDAPLDLVLAAALLRREARP